MRGNFLVGKNLKILFSGPYVISLEKLFKALHPHKLHVYLVS